MAEQLKQPHAPPPDVIDLSDARAFRAQKSSVSIDQIMIHVQDLLRKLEILPRVDMAGESDCPFAEDLFAQKEEAAAKLREDLTDLLNVKQELEVELGHCQHNLNQIGIDAGRLRTHPALEAYDEASQKLIEQAESLQREIDTITMLIDFVSAALKRSGQLRFPGGEPRRSVAPGPVASTTITRSPTPVSSMINGTINLGPRVGRGGTFGGW